MAANKDLEDKLQEMNAASDKSVVDLKERIQVLEKELHNANELLSSSKLRGLFFLRLLTCFQLIGGVSHASACTLGTYCNLFSNIWSENPTSVVTCSAYTQIVCLIDSATHNVAFLNKVRVSCTFWPGPVSSTSLLNEEQLTTLSPTAAAASKIKPGMKLTEVD